MQDTTFFNIDLHCDLLSYFLHPNQGTKEEIGCSLPYLLEGNVAVQVMAIYSATEKGSVGKALQQAEIYSQLLEKKQVYPFKNQNVEDFETGKILVIPAIENASGFCEEDEPLEQGFKNLEKLVEKTGKIAYVTITHHLENRFGGGNMTETGLKPDGKILLDYLAEKGIPVDFSHTSDQLAYDILNYIDQKNYTIPVLASHSNSRFVFNHKRNLPDELVSEIINRDGIIGINFIKDFVNPNDPEFIYRHIEHFLKLGAKNHLAYGADFFYDLAHPDQSRYPFFHNGYNNALVYNKMNEILTKEYSKSFAEKISHQNALNFFHKNLKIKE